MYIYNKINKYDLEQGYHLIKRIIDNLMKKNNVSYGSSANATNKYKEMRKFRDENGYFEVFNGGDHGYLGKYYNIKFRALHDSMHYSRGLTFSFEDEKELSDISAKLFSSIAYNEFNANHWECYLVYKIMTAEIRGQIEHYELNKNYVNDQKEFINTYLNVRNEHARY